MITSHSWNPFFHFLWGVVQNIQASEFQALGLMPTRHLPWRRQWWHPTPVLLPGKSHGQRSLVGCSPWGGKESDMTEWLHFHFYALEKEMATHSSVLAWRIPGMGLHRVGRYWSDLAVAADTSPCWWIFSRVLCASKRTTDSSPTWAVLHIRMKRLRSPSCDPDQKRIRESYPLWRPIFITCLLTSLERTPDSWQGCCLIPREKPKWSLFLKHGFASLTLLLKNLLVASHCNW